MKKVLFLLLISTICFSQENTKYIEVFNNEKELIEFQNFSLDNNFIIWQKVFESNDKDVTGYFRKQLRLTFLNEDSGTSINNNLECKGIAFYASGNFNFKFLIEIKENKYRVSVSGINFENQLQYNVGNVSTSNSSINLESVALRDSNNTFRKNSQIKTDLECLNQYFTNLFTIQNKIDKGW